ncbi:MAG: TlpA family protein disulfide reductase [Anaerolineae bacterium]|nr:TlpA family protein disulfide reductase [Anaerolineae bacterium]MCI0610185.1 TlpA family protein disulfide reductase [Anaerolineae bacterium]
MNRKAHTQTSKSSFKFSTILLLAGLGVIIVFGAIGWNAWRNSQTTGSGIQPGQIAPDFTVPTLGGGTFTLSQQRGKPAIIFFMAYWCGSCIPEAAALGQLQQEYGNAVSIVAVNVDPSGTWEAIEQFKQAAGDGAFVWASDTDQKVTLDYQLRSLDTTYILDGDGRIVYRDEIPTLYQTLKAELEELAQ